MHASIAIQNITTRARQPVRRAQQKMKSELLTHVIRGVVFTDGVMEKAA
jgi:hypothetical protein